MMPFQLNYYYLFSDITNTDFLAEPSFFSKLQTNGLLTPY